MIDAAVIFISVTSNSDNCCRYKERIREYAKTFHPDFYRPLGKAVGLVEHVAKVGKLRQTKTRRTVVEKEECFTVGR